MREREGEAKASISFSFIFRVFDWPMAYIPVAQDSFGATGCPRSRVQKKMGGGGGHCFGVPFSLCFKKKSLF